MQTVRARCSRGTRYSCGLVTIPIIAQVFIHYDTTSNLQGNTGSPPNKGKKGKKGADASGPAGASSVSSGIKLENVSQTQYSAKLQLLS